MSVRTRVYGRVYTDALSAARLASTSTDKHDGAARTGDAARRRGPLLKPGRNPARNR